MSDKCPTCGVTQTMGDMPQWMTKDPKVTVLAPLTDAADYTDWTREELIKTLGIMRN